VLPSARWPASSAEPRATCASSARPKRRLPFALWPGGGGQLPIGHYLQIFKINSSVQHAVSVHPLLCITRDSNLYLATPRLHCLYIYETCILRCPLSINYIMTRYTWYYFTYFKASF
jgi:hypothetical protein